MMVRTSAFIAATLIAGASAFVVPNSQSIATSRKSQELFVNTPNSPTGWNSFEGLVGGLPSGEEQRKFRRTVYSHDDWRKHRNQDRFVNYLAAIFKSGVYKNLAGEVFLATACATFVCFYNAVFGGYQDFAGVAHGPLLSIPLFQQKIGLPISAFTLTSSSLGLLLVFRTNTSYQRWDEARKNWGMNINHTRDLVRMANAYYDSTGVTPEQRADDLQHVALCTWAFVRCMKRHLSPADEDEDAFIREIYQKLPPKQAEMIAASAHRPNRALQDLSFAIDDLPMHFMRKNEIHRAVTIFEDDLGSSERILTSPVPLFYSRHLARYLAVWMFLLPLGIYDAFSSTWNHIGMIPATVVISTMLFGIEEIGTQLEEPFTVLPMQAFCDKIYNWCMEIVSWQPGDNGRPMKPVKPEHQYFTGGYTANGASYAAPAAEPVYAQAAVEASSQEQFYQPAAATQEQPNDFESFLRGQSGN